MSTTPREPEIEFLRRAVRAGLFAFRGATAVAGAAAVVFALVEIACHLADADLLWCGDGVAGNPARDPIAPHFVWFCVGIPPLLPVRWLFVRGRGPLLAAGVLAWFGPMLLPGDHDWGWLIRLFASFVAVSVLFVWKTLFQLTRWPADHPTAKS